MTDADAVAGTDQRQPEQLWVALDPSEQFGIGKLQVLQSGVDISRAFAVQQSGKSKAIDESLDFCGRHGFLLQIYQLNRDAALFEKAFGRASRLRVLDAEDLDSWHMARFCQTKFARLAPRRQPQGCVRVMLKLMPVVISMLRGVNVGPHKRMRMEDLRALYSSLKLRDPQTYVQSGNVVFKTDESDLAILAKRIEAGIEKKFGFRSDVILRTAADLRRVIEKNPFAGRTDVDPSKLLVTFLASDPGEEVREKIRAIEASPEELWMDGRELYIYYPNGMARPTLAFPVIEKTLKTSATGRNWNTVTNLRDLAERLEASP